MIYLASPYTSPNPALMEERFEKACAAVAQLMNEGATVYSPIVSCHPVAIRHDLPRDWTYWERFDREMINLSIRLIVLKVEGWDTSKGVTAEVEYARSRDIPVEYMEAV